MNQKHLVYAILVFAIMMSITLPNVTSFVLEAKSSKIIYESQNNAKLTNTIKTNKSVVKVVESASNMELAIATSEVKEEPKEEVKEETKLSQVVQEKTQKVSIIPAKPYNEMNSEELVQAINNGSFKLEYSKAYDTKTSGLTKSKGAIYYDNHKETYYSERILKGSSLNIPGRHTAEDGTVRDGDGYICVAANPSYLSKGTIVKTSLGPAKVYDTGCASGIVDIYTNW